MAAEASRVEGAMVVEDVGNGVPGLNDEVENQIW